MGAMATTIQWGAGALIALGLVTLLIAPFAAVWVLGLGIAVLVGATVWTARAGGRDEPTPGGPGTSGPPEKTSARERARARERGAEKSVEGSAS